MSFICVQIIIKTKCCIFRKIVKSSQVTFIYIALFTIQIVSKQLHSENKESKHDATSLKVKFILKCDRKLLITQKMLVTVT